jgi:hypothetical protein
MKRAGHLFACGIKPIKGFHGLAGVLGDQSNILFFES